MNLSGYYSVLREDALVVVLSKHLEGVVLEHNGVVVRISRVSQTGDLCIAKP